MAPRNRVIVTFRNAEIIFKNFAGEAKKYNPEGVRNFSILLDQEQAEELAANGWNVKQLNNNDPDDEPRFHLKVAVSFKVRAPRCWLISNIDPNTGLGRNKTMIGESLVGIFDGLEANKIDLEISAYDWKMDNGDSGRKAYLESLYFTMYEGELDRDYADLEQVPAAGEQVSAPDENEEDSHRFGSNRWDGEDR